MVIETRICVALACVVAMLACGGSSTQTGGGAGGMGGTGGTGGSGASGGTAGSGGSGLVAPAAQGGLAINVSPVSGGNCAIAPHDAQIGTNPPSQNNPGDRVIDGQDGASVGCQVVYPTPGTVSGSLEHGSMSFHVTGDVGATGGTAHISEYDPQNATTLQGDCTLSIIPPQEIAAGRIWASFACEAFSDPAQPTGTSCSASGTFVFENCSAAP